MNRLLLPVTICFFLFVSPVAADAELDKLIEELAKVSEPGVGYSAGFSGSMFLPYDDSEMVGVLVLGGTRRFKSETMLKIVQKGADAVPALLKHISDKRKISLEPLKGLLWAGSEDFYDFNHRTRFPPPAGVNSKLLQGDSHENSYSVTIGDLCFVAIGQIVNRNYFATRYQPSGGLIVNSPTECKPLRDALIADWSGFTKDKHRRLLIQDFEKPDDENRRIGAYWRLSFYYPDTVEKLVLKNLEIPTIDLSRIQNFCQETLYKAKPEERKNLYQIFINKMGDRFVFGVVDQLFSDLADLESDEKNMSLVPYNFGTKPRELLIQLFDKPPTVKSSDRPWIDLVDDYSRADFIGSLTHDKSKNIGEVVKNIYIKNYQNKTMALACLKCLANRGYGPFLVEQLNKIDYSNTTENRFNTELIEGIATSRDPLVRERLLRIIKETVNEDYFMMALSGLPDADDNVVWNNAKRILDGLPDKTKDGSWILDMIATKFPEKLEGAIQSFLVKNTTERANTICEVLWYGHPLSPKILLPLLDDKRKLTGFAVPLCVSDRAAQALSHWTEEIKFDSEWPQKKKDEAILKIKEFCKNRK